MHKVSHREEPKSERALFLDEAHRMMEESKDLIKKLNQSPEIGHQLFRILHTMKANAQIHKVQSLADAIHSAESVVSKINDKIANKQEVLTDDLQSLESETKFVASELNKQSKQKAA